MVIDETHQILTTQEYRKLFAKLQALAEFPIAKLLLTASLPKRLEADLLIAFGLPLSTKILRAPSDQPHISFNQVKYSSMNTKPIHLAIDVAKLMNTIMDEDQIGIIFCTSKTEVDQLESFTKCSSYSSHPLKAQNENLWKSGSHRWIAATTGLIQGIDAPNVGATIFIGLPYGLINLYQGSGRGGRDGRKCWSISIIPSNPYPLVEKLTAPNDPSCSKEADEWQRTLQCRRLGFSQTFDRSQVQCHDLPNCHLCDFCDPNSPIMAGVIPLISESSQSSLTPPTLTAPAPGTHLTMAEEIMFDSFEELDWNLVPDTTQAINHQSSKIPNHLQKPLTATPSLSIQHDAVLYQRQNESKKIKAKKLDNLANILNGKCPICWAYNANNLQPSHLRDKLFIKCNPKSTGFIPHLLGWIDLKKKMKFQKYQYCYSCHFPQALSYLPTCHPSFGSSNGSANSCPLADSIILLVWFIRHSDDWWNKAILAFPTLTTNMDFTAFSDWLNLGDSLNSFYNGLELVLWFFEHHQI